MKELLAKWKEYVGWCNLADNGVITKKDGEYTTYQPRLKTLEDFMEWLERNTDENQRY